jgi:hypothetical protein
VTGSFRLALSAVVAILTLLRADRVLAQDARPSKATFALIVGSNQSVDNLTPLKYADDDAARYLDLFRLLGARTYLLSRLDDNTRRLHPQAAAEADEPKRAPFDRAVAQLAQDVAQAKARGVETLVYLVYAGHGNVKNGQGYITLEDARITGAELAQIVGRIPAARVHVIVDACASYYLAYSRGPGGERRALEGFRASALTEDSRVGVLLSTSSARESHEWDAFEGGVFSHEVRSGLYGAADADGNGEVTYREIAAFVARANAAVPSDRYRPDVYARAPRGSDTLLDIRSGLQRRLVIDGKRAAHYFLEDARGVRVADVHNAPGQTLSLVRPGPTIPVYLRRAEDDREFLITPAPEVIALADLAESEPRTRARGAAHESFSLVFSLPFDSAVVSDYRDPPPPSAPPPDADADVHGTRNVRVRKTLGFVALGIGAVGLGAGAFFSLSASAASGSSPADESQADAVARNSRISKLNTAGVASFVAGGAAAGTGLVLLLWPSAPKNVQVSVLPGGGRVGYVGSF